MYEELKVPIQVFFCIAVEEMEAWLLGDSEALLKAYPMAKRQLMQKYVQDSVIGTWEYLADIVYKGGLQALKRNASSYYEIGQFKCECAKNIGKLLDISPRAQSLPGNTKSSVPVSCGAPASQEFALQAPHGALSASPSALLR